MKNTETFEERRRHVIAVERWHRETAAARVPPRSTSRLFHRTTMEAAKAIVAGGFRDATGSYMFLETELTGVFLSDVPLDCNEGARGDALLEVHVDVPLDAMAEWEIVEEGECAGCYREWCVPAAWIATHGFVTASLVEYEAAS